MDTILIIIIVALLLALWLLHRHHKRVVIDHAPAGLDTPQAVIDFLKGENAKYVAAEHNKADISVALRSHTALNGQEPYAVIVTCSDSRVPVEHIFHAGIGEIFVIRTAGNVVGDFELGSIEYGAEHLHAKLVLVLGHIGCGAVDAALHGHAHGHIAHIVEEIACCLPEGCDARTAELLNVEHAISRIRGSEVIQQLEAAGRLMVCGALYDIVSGEVKFID